MPSTEGSFSPRNAMRMLITTLLLVPLVMVLHGSAGALPPDGEVKLRPVRIVVLVDESGSLKPEDIAREREAAQVIAQGELSSESTVAVTGFASAGSQNRSVVDPVCPPTELNTPENRQFLVDCIGTLKPRAEADGDETDHVNALRQARSYLTGPDAGDQPKIIFMLTDGKLNVGKSESYGKGLSPQDRTEAARQQIPGLLGELSQAGIQVWPLGFGAVDQQQLQGFAADSAQQGCGLNTPKPTAKLINSSADLLGAMRDAFTAARCVGPGGVETDELRGGKAELAVDIPPIATDSSILVFKRDPHIAVAYIDPKGTSVPTNGTDGISKFELSGQNSGVESLRIIDPMPGTWKVRLTSAPGAPAQQVAATVIYQGAVQAVLTVNPPAPSAGQEVNVGLQVRARRAPITDPALLTGLAFAVELSGDGFTPVGVNLTDDDRNGQYDGRITVPGGANGALAFKGSVTGIGISGDERTLNTRVQAGPPAVLAQLALADGRGEVTVGTSLAGEASITNNSGRPLRIQLQVAEPAPGTVLTVDPQAADVAATGSTKVPFKLTFGNDTTLGPNQALLLLVNEAAPLTQLPVTRTVTAVPTIWQKLFWPLLGLAVLVGLALLALLLRLHRRRERLKVRGLRLELFHNTKSLSTLSPRANAGRVFRFVIRTDFAGPRADHPGAAERQAYEIRRDPNGTGLLTTDPSGSVDRIGMGDRWDLGEGGLTAVVTDRHGKATQAGPQPPFHPQDFPPQPPVGATVPSTPPVNQPDWY